MYVRVLCHFLLREGGLRRGLKVWSGLRLGWGLGLMMKVRQRLQRSDYTNEAPYKLCKTSMPACHIPLTSRPPPVSWFPLSSPLFPPSLPAQRATLTWPLLTLALCSPKLILLVRAQPKAKMWESLVRVITALALQSLGTGDVCRSHTELGMALRCSAALEEQSKNSV